MMTKNYAYNADFLEHWIKKNGMKKDEFQQRMGINAQSYYRWVEDKSNPMPVQHILKFCNMFGENISNFFTDGGETAELQIMPARHQPSRRVSSITQMSDDLTVNFKEQILQMKLECAEKIQKVKDDAQAREDAIRAKAEEREKILEEKYEARIEEYQRMIKLMDVTHREGTNLIKKALDLSQAKDQGTNTNKNTKPDTNKENDHYELPSWPPIGVADNPESANP